MPSLEHDGVVELFRGNPPLALRILDELFHLPVPDHASVRIANSALNQMLPIEFRADLVLDVLDARGNFVLAIVLESQCDIKARKLYSWPVYVTVSRAERECPVILMVIAVDEDVANWAEQAIDLGVGRGTIRPVVLGPRTIPAITDERVARKDTELALLSGMTHGNETNGEDVLHATLEGIKQLDDERAMVYFQILWNVLRAPMQQALSRLVMEKQRLHDANGNPPKFLEELRAMVFKLGEEKGFHDGEAKGFHDGEAKGFHDGEAKGFHDGEAKGFHDGELKTLRDNILRLARRRNFTLNDDQQTRIHACTDRETLDHWLDNIIDASSAEDIFR